MITQPALSRALRVLERTVGVPLLVRGPRRTELTVAGSAFLAEAHEMMDRSRTALERARGTSAEVGAEVEVETLTVSAPECDVVLVSAESRAFEQDNPGLRVHVVPRGWTLPPDDLRAGEADVSFLRDCFDRRDLIVELVTWEPRSVLLSPEHHLASRKRLTTSDLRDEPVTYWEGMSPAQADHWAGADGDRYGRRQGPTVRSTSDVLNAVILGRAIAFAHGSTLPEEIAGVRIRPVDGLSPSRLEIGIPADAATPVAKQFMEYVRSRWRPERR